MIHILRAEHLRDYRVRFTFSDRREGVVDLSPVVLKDPREAFTRCGIRRCSPACSSTVEPLLAERPAGAPQYRLFYSSRCVREAHPSFEPSVLSHTDSAFLAPSLVLMSSGRAPWQGEAYLGRATLRFNTKWSKSQTYP
jgi:hypothetical protein